jgi:tRNA A-37 threonylcarbamoyl transferase component Bud32
VECDDVMLLLATCEQRTLSPLEETQLRNHTSTCATCQALSIDVVWPIVDPIVFAKSTEVISGGMGRITRAYDRRLGRELAIKEVLGENLRRRFEREARITARLQHPAIVPIYEAGQFPGGTSFYTMRFVTGRTLQQAIDAAPTLLDRLGLMPHVRSVADALAYAHAHGVIHRDLKPGNVLVGEFGETVVIDWGLAKDLDGDDDDAPHSRASEPSLTQYGSVMGTPCFMSPAQAAGAEADATDDVYALGAILYQTLAGAPPYWDTTTQDADELIKATIAHAPTPIAELAPEAPPDLHAIVSRAMSRDKAARYPTAKELADELARFEAGQLLISRAYGVRELAMRWLKRHRRAAILGALAIVAAIVLAVTLVRYRRTNEELAIRAHGAKLTDLYGEVARQGYHIDRDLLRLENALEGLAAAAAWALEGPEPDGPPIYFDTDFKTKPPPGFTKGAYRWEVSIEHPVVGVAPGVDRQAYLGKIKRLVPLRKHIREMVVEAAIGDTTKTTPAEANAIMLQRKSPIDYAYVDLQEGIHFMWPGMAALRSTYDVRTSSFYIDSAYKRGRHWGAPYVDSTTDRAGDDLVLPCTKGVWSQSGEFLGVAGVEMTVTKMVERSMAMPKRRTLRTSLVDDKGRKVIDSADANKLFPAGDRDVAIDFVPFDLPTIAEEIRQHHEGVRETTRAGKSIVVAFTRLDAIGWYYVVEVEAAGLGAR